MSDVDNPLDQGLMDLREDLRVSPDESISNPVPHTHHYVLKGSGLSCWAECDAVVSVWNRADNGRSVVSGICGEKLAGDNGPIVGGRQKVERAMP